MRDAIINYSKHLIIMLQELLHKHTRAHRHTQRHMAAVFLKEHTKNRYKAESNSGVILNWSFHWHPISTRVFKASVRQNCLSFLRTQSWHKTPYEKWTSQPLTCQCNAHMLLGLKHKAASRLNGSYHPEKTLSCIHFPVTCGPPSLSSTNHLQCQRWAGAYISSH